MRRVTDTNTFLTPRPLSDHPVDVGLRTEAAITAELLKRGFRILQPVGSNQRYDLVVDLGDRFARLQCKTGRLRNGCVLFSARSVRSSMTKTATRTYAGEVDFFAVYCPETDDVYVVPLEDAARASGCLRVEPTANNQSRNVRWARDYALPSSRPPLDAA